MDDSTTQGRFPCPIQGCNASYMKATDVSRHKWSHLPTVYLPSCPFVDKQGTQCSYQYVGRASLMKTHWQRDHKKERPYPENYHWPTLNDLLAQHNITLGERTPSRARPATVPQPLLPQPGPSTTPSAIPHATIPSFDVFGCIERMQQHMHWSLDQHRFPEQTRNLNLDAVNLNPQDHLQAQPPFPNFPYNGGMSSMPQGHFYPGLVAPVPIALPSINGLVQGPGSSLFPQEFYNRDSSSTTASIGNLSGDEEPLVWNTYLDENSTQ